MGTAVVLLFGLVVAEVALRKFMPFEDPLRVYKHIKKGADYVPSAHPPNFSGQTRIEEGLPTMKGVAKYTMNNLGYRGDPLAQPKPANEYRIFMVGGSTTIQLAADDSEVTTRFLQTELAARLPGPRVFKVYNAGKVGDRSFDHVAMIVHRIVHLQPDAIILLAGINDLRAASVGNTDYLMMKARADVDLDRTTLVKLLATEFQIPRRLYALAQKVKTKTDREIFEGVAETTNLKEKVAARKAKTVSDDIPKTNVSAFRENLLTIAGVARAHGIRLVMMTQASSWMSKIDPQVKEWHWATLGGDTLFAEERMEEALEKYNDATRALASEQHLDLVDAHRLLPKSLEYFFDDCHYTTKGNRDLALKLADTLVPRLQVP